MKKLAILIAASTALVSSHVMALGPTVTPELTVKLSGASAQDNSIRNLMEGLCLPGTLDSYNELGTAAIQGYNGYFCRIANADLIANSATFGPTVAATDTNGNNSVDVLVLKRSAGGSGMGPEGLCGAGVEQLLINSTCKDDGTGGDPVAGDRNYRCPSITGKTASNGGLSDLEFSKLPGWEATGDLCANGGESIWGTIFNTPVSRNLRDALQCSQGLTVGSETEANMPSLPKSVIASLFNGSIASWNTIRVANGNTLRQDVLNKIADGSCPGYNAATYPVPSDMRARVCRRVDTSGTNTQFRVKFLNAAGCGGGPDQLKDNTIFSDETTNAYSNWQNVNPPIPTAPAIITASGSSDMRDCIQSFSDASTPATQRWAIGIQSTENNINLADNYRFIKIDGSAPTIENVIKLKYWDWVESVWGVLGNPAQQAFQRMLITETGKAANLGQFVDDNYISSYGPTGLVALNSISISGNNPSLPISHLNPVATSTHKAGASSGPDSCNTPRVNVNTPAW